jgi:hypothetical protein
MKTDPIKRQHVEPTIDRLFADLREIFPKAAHYFDKSSEESAMTVLGSAGKKAMSGDIDLGITENSFKDIVDEWGLDKEEVDKLIIKYTKSSRTSTEDQIRTRSITELIAKKINESGKQIEAESDSSGAVFLSFPQYSGDGEVPGLNVQVDINVGNLDWMKWSYYSDEYPGNVKGLHRTQLLVALYKHLGLIFSHKMGITKNTDVQTDGKKKTVKEVITTDPDIAIDVLNKGYGISLEKEDTKNFFDLLEFMQDHLSEERLNDVLDTYMRILDSTRCDIPEVLQQYWIDNQERLGLKGKFLPSDSELVKYQTEAGQ